MRRLNAAKFHWARRGGGCEKFDGDRKLEQALCSVLLMVIFLSLLLYRCRF